LDGRNERKTVLKIELSDKVIAMLRLAHPNEEVTAVIERMVMANISLPDRLSAADWEMLACIVQVESTCTISSLFQFLEWYIADYATAWRRLTRLEIAGLVEVHRNGHGRPMTFHSSARGRALLRAREGLRDTAKPALNRP
jgi:hypothetical protein